jgi:hypothetical protein
MRLSSLHWIPLRWFGDLYRKFQARKNFRIFVEAAKIGAVMIFTVLLSMEYLLPSAQSKPRSHSPWKQGDFLSSLGSSRDPSAREVLNLASMIRLITDDQLSEGKVLRYAGLIFQAAQKYSVNPLEIVAIIVAESQFKESSVNAKTGDYGLGQINWRHWGKDYGLTTQDLLDPAINIYMTCHVYKFFGQDFGKYHRGNGVKSNAYMVNVKGILSTLHAYAEMNEEDAS